MDKQTLRKVYLEKRITLTNEEYKSRNAKLEENFFDFFNIESLQYVHIFLSIYSKKEPNTWGMIKRIKESFTSVNLVVPKVENTLLRHYLYTGKKNLEGSAWGIFEPKGGLEVDVKKLDMILVPLVSYDLNGNRIGYGKGFYDKFLSQCRDDAIKVGLSLSPPLDTIPYRDDHDIPLDYCVYPLGVSAFK